MEQALLDTAEIKLLAEVGFLASARGDVARAEAIFGALLRLRAQRPFAHIGLALAFLNAGRAFEAVQLLEVALQQVDADGQQELQAFRGLALQLAGRQSESQRALAQAGEHRMARVMLGHGTIAPHGD